MKKLAINGGPKIIPFRFRTFEHPKLSKKIVHSFSNEAFRHRMCSFESKDVHILQNEFKKIYGLKYSLSTNSGASALYAMYYGLGLQRGDEVITSIYSFFATVTPLVHIGCNIKFVDTLPNGNIDPKEIIKKISPKTRAIIITHMWGIPCDMDEIMQISDKYKIPVLEDASHAHGGTYNGKLLGTFGVCSAWSLGSKKIISGGQGGILATNHNGLYQKAILLGHANNKIIKDITFKNLLPYSITGTGINLRMHPFSAMIINQQLPVLKKQVIQRNDVMEFFRKKLKKIPGFNVPKIPFNSIMSGYAFPILYDSSKVGISRGKFFSALRAEGATEIDIPQSTCPLSEFQIFRQGKINFEAKKIPELNLPFNFPNAYAFHENVVKLPTWYGADRLKYATSYINGIEKVLRNINEID